MLLYYIVYSSVATEPFQACDLEQILVKARAKNHQLRVTGLLLHSAGQILQVLEGEPETVQELYRDITHDRRHDNVVTITEGHSDRRLFPDWSMGFGDASAPAFTRLTGYVNSSQANFLLPRAHNMPIELRDLLLSFIARPEVG